MIHEQVHFASIIHIVLGTDKPDHSRFWKDFRAVPHHVCVLPRPRVRSGFVSISSDVNLWVSVAMSISWGLSPCRMWRNLHQWRLWIIYERTGWLTDFILNSGWVGEVKRRFSEMTLWNGSICPSVRQLVSVHSPFSLFLPFPVSSFIFLILCLLVDVRKIRTRLRWNYGSAEFQLKSVRT